MRVTAKDGKSGIGFTYAGASAAIITQAAVDELLGPLLLGKPSYMIEGLWDGMYRESLLHGRCGSVMRAVSALDIAIWDLNARRAEAPLWRYLGAKVEDRVPCYASGGYYQPGKSPDDLAKEMKAYKDRGFRSVKMKIGGADPTEDELRVRCVREAIGPDALLFLDANNAWKDLLTALPPIRRLEAYSPAWIEEPFSPDDIENHARLVSATPIPIATGEIEAGRWRFRVLLESRAAHVLQPDAVVCGGITEWRRIAALASAYGVPVCPHAWHDVHAHLVASTTNAPFVEYFVDEGIVNTQPLFTRRMEMDGGDLILPSDPGLGFDFDEARVSQYAIGGWQTCNGRH